MLNRQVVLKRHPQGIPLPEDFDLVEGAIAQPTEGQMLVRNLFFSLEAAIRGWLDGKANYFEPIPLGGAIRGPSVARVVESHLAGFEAGDLIFGLHHWEDYSLSDANTVPLSKLSPPLTSIHSPRLSTTDCFCPVAQESATHFQSVEQ